MRKLFMAVAILGISATVSFAKAQCVNEMVIKNRLR